MERPILATETAMLSTVELLPKDYQDEEFAASKKEPEMIEEYIEEPVEQELMRVEEAPEVEMSFETVLELHEEPRRLKRPKSRKYKYPVNTNDKLSEEQKVWINKQVRNCEVVQDGQMIYKCPFCEILLQIPGSLKKHLRDTHILKSDKQQDDWNSKKAFKDEIKESLLVVDTINGPETIWKCQRCDINRIFRSEAGLKVHIRYNHIRSQVIDAKFIAQCKIVVDSDGSKKDAWKCPECSKILKSRDGLRNHMKLEHPNAVNDKTVDETDFKRFESVSGNDSLLNLLESKRRTLKSDPASCSCSECGLQFINGTSKKEKSCRIHNECHKILDVVSLYYQLPKCDVSKTMFSNDDDLNTFLQSDQRYFDPLPCDGMAAKVSQQLKESIGTASRDDPDAWRCGHCGASYLTEVECNSHVMILHSKKLICPVDHMEFEGSRGVSHFNIHMRNKHFDMFPDLVISCTYCHAEFGSVFEKLAHMKTCTAKKFECDHCSRKYFTKTELGRHLKIVSGEIAYVCDICSKPCSSTMDLKLHRTAHTNLKSYPCSFPDCNKAFKTPAARSSHMETHSNVIYSCPSCTASFRQRALLQRHSRKGCCRRSSKESSKSQIVFEEIYVTD